MSQAVLEAVPETYRTTNQQGKGIKQKLAGRGVEQGQSSGLEKGTYVPTG